MSVEIVSIGDKRLAISNDAWAASLDVGTGWNRIRIGWRWAVNDTGANLAALQAYMGVLSNPTAGLAESPLLATCTHYVGSYRIGTAARTAGPPTYYVPSFRVCKKVGATITSAIPGVTATFLSASPSTINTVHITEIVKGAPNYTINHLFARGSAALVDIADLAPLTNTLLGPVPFIETGLNAYIGGAGTRYSTTGASVAVDEGVDGALNAVTVAWEETSAINFKEILVAIVT